jgi:hypothetical protein
MTKLENLHIQLKTHYHIEEEALEQLKSHRLNDNEIRDIMFESCIEDFEQSLRSDLERVAREHNCVITNIHIDIDYPTTDVYFDAEFDDVQGTFMKNVINALTENEHSSYARFSELEDSVSVYAAFEELDAEQ